MGAAVSGFNPSAQPFPGAGPVSAPSVLAVGRAAVKPNREEGDMLYGNEKQPARKRRIKRLPPKVGGDRGNQGEPQKRVSANPLKEMLGESSGRPSARSGGKPPQKPKSLAPAHSSLNRRAGR